MELVGSDTVDRRDGAAEDVVSSVELFGLLDSVDVEWFFDDENGRFVAVGVVVKFRNFFVRVDEGKSDWARFHAIVEAGEGDGDVFADARAIFEQEIGIALGGAGADAG